MSKRHKQSRAPVLHPSPSHPHHLQPPSTQLMAISSFPLFRPKIGGYPQLCSLFLIRRSQSIRKSRWFRLQNVPRTCPLLTFPLLIAGPHLHHLSPVFPEIALSPFSLLLPRCLQTILSMAVRVILFKTQVRSCFSSAQSSAAGTSLAVQWLRLHASTAGGVGSIPGPGTKIPHTVPKKKKKKNLCSSSPSHSE